MKKLVMAAAVLGAFAGGAQAQTSVTLYGIADGDIRFDHTNIGTLKSVGSGGESGSRWGMRGTEDLGGGMTANFNLTGGFGVDTSAIGQSAAGAVPLLFGREAWVGLSGGFGAVTLGRQVTILANGPWAITGGYANYDAWANTTFNGGFGNAASIAHDAVRKNNSVQYQTPAMGGFTGTVMWAPGENGIALGTGASNYWSLGLGYANGPVNVQFGYEHDKVIPGAALAPSGTALGKSQGQWALAGTYDLGVVKLGASVERASLVTTRDKGYALSASAPLGPISVDFEYAREETKIASVFASKASAINLRVNYPLSKRTKVYALISDGNSNTAVAGAKQNLNRYMVGMRHVF